MHGFSTKVTFGYVHVQRQRKKILIFPQIIYFPHYCKDKTLKGNAVNRT